MKMKKILYLILTCLFCNAFLLGCNHDPYKIEKVDGYSIVRIRERDNKGVALVGVDDSNLVNNTFIVPEKIDGETVLSLGCKKDSLWPSDDNIMKFENNSHIYKLVINNNLAVYPFVLTLCNDTVKEIEINCLLDKCPINKPLAASNLFAAKLKVKNMGDFGEWVLPAAELRKIDLEIITLSVLPVVYRPTEYHPEKLLFYKIASTTVISDTFEKYTSLSTFIIPNTVTEIDKNSFTNSTVDIYARAEKEDMPDSMNNGWDNNLNVTYGFKDEIVVFDSFDGSPVVFEETGKNYVVAQKGQKIAPPEAPVKDGYKFEGWFTDYVYSKKWNFETDIVTDSTLLIAKWTEVK